MLYYGERINVQIMSILIQVVFFYVLFVAYKVCYSYNPFPMSY